MNFGMKLVIVMVADLLTQALVVSPNNSLPRPGMCGIQRPDPRAYQQQLNRNGSSGGSRTLLLGGGGAKGAGVRVQLRAPHLGVSGGRPPENFLDSRSSEMGSSAI